MADQAKSGWNNPIRKEHVVGFGVGIVATAIFSFGYPGWFMSRSAAEEQRMAEVNAVHAAYCLDSYLASGVTVAQAKDLRTKATGAQADVFVKAGHAADEEIGRVCGRELDKLSTDALIEAAIKKAMTTSAKVEVGSDKETKQN